MINTPSATNWEHLNIDNEKLSTKIIVPTIVNLVMQHYGYKMLLTIIILSLIYSNYIITK